MGKMRRWTKVMNIRRCDMSILAQVFVLAFLLAFAGTAPAIAQTVVDFEEFEFTPLCGAPPVIESQGVVFTATPDDACLTIYQCLECVVYPPGNKTLALSTVGPVEAVLTATFSAPVPSVSLEVSDTEHSVTVLAYSPSNALVFEASFTPSDPVTRLLAVSSPEGIARIEILDVGGDGLVADNLTFPVPPCEIISDLLARVQSAGLHQGIQRSLEAKLLAAQRTLCDDDLTNDGAARGPLGAFQNELSAQREKKVEVTLADSLSDEAQVIIDEL